MGPGGMTAMSRNTAGTQQIVPMAVNARSDNSVNYVTPDWSGFQGRLHGALGEGSAQIGRTYGASARYNSGPLNAVAAWTRQNGANNANGRVDAATVGGSYDFRVAQAFLGYTREKNDCSTCTGNLARVAGVTGRSASDFRLINLGVRVPLGGVTGIAQIVRIQDRSQYAVPTGNRDANWISLSAEYPLSKRSLLYTGLGTIGNRNGSGYAMGAGVAQQAPSSVLGADTRSKTFVMGLRHAF